MLAVLESWTPRPSCHGDYALAASGPCNNGYIICNAEVKLPNNSLSPLDCLLLMGMPLRSQQASSRDAAIWTLPIEPVQQRRALESRPVRPQRVVQPLNPTTGAGAIPLAVQQTVRHDGNPNAPWLTWPTGNYPGPGSITRVEDWPIVDPGIYRAYPLPSSTVESRDAQEIELPPPFEAESRLEERYPEHVDFTSVSLARRFIIHPELYFISQRPLPPHMMAQEQYNASRAHNVEPGTTPRRRVVLGPFEPGSN